MKYIKNFSVYRVMIIASGVIIQLLVLIGVIIRFNAYFVYFYGITTVVSAIVVLCIINNNSNPAYKLAWIIPILIFPIFGGLFYIFFGRDNLNGWVKQEMKLIETRTKESLTMQRGVLEAIRRQNETAAAQSSYIQSYAYYPPYQNTLTEYLAIGEVKYERLKQELEKAEHYIFLEYYIIGEGVMWNSILEILVKKVQSGVDVRIIYDDIGCLFTLPPQYNKKLEKLGIQCCVFNPVVPVLSAKVNTRDHRKIAVIDGSVGFTGGINLADEYINEFEKYGHWKDAAIMIKGEAVWNLTVMFLSMWGYLRGTTEDFTRFKKMRSVDSLTHMEGFVQPFADSPLDNEPVGSIVYQNLINKATRYIYITTPYLIIDNNMVVALSSAAKSGVDVRIITPYHADKKIVHEVSRSYYRVLVESGVKIYEYTPGFIHSKTYVADDEYGIVGTINMDYRSLYLHFECGIWMYKGESILKMKNDFLHTLRMCKGISIEDMKKLKWYRVLLGSILRLFAPLM